MNGTANSSLATVLAVYARNSTLTCLNTPSGDEATYNPHVAKTMMAESTVFRKEQRGFAPVTASGSPHKALPSETGP